MAIEPDEYRLNDLATAHDIGTELFMPFVVRRLAGDSGASEALLMVRLRDAAERVAPLRITWVPRADDLPPGVQDHTVTEWAAVGVACVLVHLYAGLRITAVAELGDCFDYWVT